MRLGRRTVGAALLWWTRAEIAGAEHVPETGGALLAGNHRSFLDHFLLGAASPRPARFLGKKELASGLGGAVNRGLGMIPVDRGRADLAALQAVVDMLRAGEVVALFPEGTRSPTGRLHRFRSGLARVAAQAAVPTVPLGLVGTAEVWPRGSAPSPRRPPPGLLAVRFGPLIGPPAPSPRARRAFTDRVRAQVAALSGQAIDESFAPIRDDPTDPPSDPPNGVSAW